MAILNEDTLRQIALDNCTQHLNQMLDANLSVNHEHGSSAWDPILNRHIYRHRASVWRDFDEVRIKVNADGRVVSFSDAKRFADPGHETLSDADLIRIATTTGLLGKGATVARTMWRSDGLLSAVIGYFVRVDYEEIHLIVNTKSAQVAAFNILRTP